MVQFGPIMIPNNKKGRANISATCILYQIIRIAKLKSVTVCFIRIVPCLAFRAFKTPPLIYTIPQRQLVIIKPSELQKLKFQFLLYSHSPLFCLPSIQTPPLISDFLNKGGCFFLISCFQVRGKNRAPRGQSLPAGARNRKRIPNVIYYMHYIFHKILR